MKKAGGEGRAWRLVEVAPSTSQGGHEEGHGPHGEGRPERPAVGPQNFGQLRLRFYGCRGGPIALFTYCVYHDGLWSNFTPTNAENSSKVHTIANGYPANAEVVYGDTDSVMVNFGFGDVAETLPKAEKVAEEVTKIFPAPVKLEFEKFIFPTC